MEYTKEMFTQKLIEFFNRHDQTKMHLVPQISDKFDNNQEEVFAHLTKVYAEKAGVTDLNIGDSTIMSFFPSAHTGI